MRGLSPAGLAAPVVCGLLLSGCCNVAILSPHLSRMDVDGQMRIGKHAGVDFGAREGAPVLAAADGQVVAITVNLEGCGLGVLLAHEDWNRYTVYCHLRRISVDEQQEVKRGHVLGQVGTTGNSGNIPHVHLELCTVACSTGHADGFTARTEDPLKVSAGFFDAAKRYPADRLVLTYPVRCEDTRAHADKRVARGCDRSYLGSIAKVVKHGSAPQPAMAAAH